MAISVFLWRNGAHLTREIDNHYKQLRANGIPTTWEETTREYEAIKKGNNAAPAYLETFGLLTNLPNFERRRSLLGKANEVTMPEIGEDERTEFKTVLEENDKAYKSINKAISKGLASYDLKWREGFAMLLKHVAQTKSLVSLLQLHAFFALEEHNSSIVLQDIEYILQVSDSLAKEPVLVSNLVRLSCYQIACRATELLLNNSKLPAEELKRLGELFERGGANEQFKAALDLERLEVVDLFEHPSKVQELWNEAPSMASKMGFVCLRLNGAWKRDQLFYLKSLKEVQDVMESPDGFRYFVLEGAEREMKREKDLTSTASRNAVRTGQVKIVSGMMLPAIYRGAQHQILSDARLRATRVGIAIERFRKEKHQFPDSLDKLVPGFLSQELRDPFTAGSLRYKRGNGCIVYSLGPDLKDDSGKQPEKETTDMKGDISFRLEGISDSSP